MSRDPELVKRFEELARKYELNYTLQGPSPVYVGVDMKDLVGLLECMEKLLAALEDL